MRTYGEAVDVRPAPATRPTRPIRPIPPTRPIPPGSLLPDEPAAVEPGQFLWRGRLYVVGAVLAHWVELGPWWTSAGSSASPAAPAAPAASPRATAAEGGDAEDEPRSVARDVGAIEREVWRVEARAGRSSNVGVYDLVRDVPAPGSGRRPRWRLARALD